jgi:hypothetical protein
MSQASDMPRLPWFSAWAKITAMRLSSSAIFFA